jgi:hypothetical protein
MKIIIVLLILSSCKIRHSEKFNEELLVKQEISDKTTDIVCVIKGENFSRCENDEVTCYTYTYGQSGGVSCKFKTKKLSNELR